MSLNRTENVLLRNQKENRLLVIILVDHFLLKSRPQLPFMNLKGEWSLMSVKKRELKWMGQKSDRHPLLIHHFLL